MYVCNCHGIRESDLSASIRTGATTVRALRERLGVGTGCGKCVCEVRHHLRNELAAKPACTGCGRCKEVSGHDKHEGFGGYAQRAAATSLHQHGAASRAAAC